MYGAFLVPAVIYALHRLRFSKGWAVPLWGVAFGLLTAGQILSLSRAGWLNMVSALVVHTMLSREFSWRMAGRIGLGALLAIGWLGSVLLLNSGVLAAIHSRTGLMPYDQDRFQVQGAILETISLSPFGIGPGKTEEAFDYAAHNLYLRVFVENGWLGGVALGALLALSVWVALKSANRSLPGAERSLYAVVAGALVGVLVNSVFIDSLHWRHFWLLLGLCWGGHAVRPEDGSECHDRQLRVFNGYDL